jgi:phage repressor protein C with HTH and peptisase S24 domain
MLCRAMTVIDQRAALERLIRERREDYAALSRLIGRNAAYIQQFIKRGVPRKLDADDVQMLAEYFGVSPGELGARAVAREDALVRIPRLDVRASAGPGALNERDSPHSEIAFERGWLRQFSTANPEHLSCIQVQGDSMEPTLGHGDDIIVDQADRGERLRDGIYVLRLDDTLMVKRLSANPATRRVTIRSDNPAYPDWPDCELSSLEILGRVIWAGRKLR